MNYIIPVFVFVSIFVALIKNCDVYSDFIDGAENGFEILKSIIAPIIAISVAVEMLKASGAMDMLFSAVYPLCNAVGFPKEVIPMVIVRPLSGSGSVGVLTSILNTYGADSRAGILASVINGSTETTFYCLCVYFSMTRVKNNLKALPCAIIGDITGIITATIMVNLLKF